MADGQSSDADADAGEEPPAKRLVRENRVGLAIVGAIFVLAVVIVVITSGGDSSDDASTVAENTAEDTSDATTTPPSTAAATGLVNMDSVPCSDLLTTEDVDEALGIADLPVSERSFFEFSSVETCTYQLADDETVYLTIEPGSPNDLEFDPELIGIASEPVPEVGEAAFWFAGLGAAEAGDAGMLAVGQTTDIGALFFRVTVGRPDLDSDGQLEVAKDVALAALPRFPGVEPGEPEPESESEPVDSEPFDRAGLSYADNLLAKEADGEWTRGEGLVETLRVFVGELDADEVLRDPDIVNTSGTGVIMLARQYLEDGEDEQAQAEIERLLDTLIPSEAELEAMAGEGQSASSTGEFDVVLVDAPSRGMQEPEPSLCEQWWGAPEPCEEIVTSPVLPPKYQIFFPRADVPDMKGWTAQHRARALATMEKTIPMFAALGRMPRIDIVFTPMPGSALHAGESANYCQVEVNPAMQADTPAHFQQRLASGLAYCYLGATFPAQIQRYYTVIWWWEGMDIWLSTLPYPQADLELERLPKQLEAMELNSTLLDRAYANWIFFEHRARELDGPPANVRLAASMPTSGGAGAQADALAASQNAEDIMSKFVQGLTDANMPDSGGKVVPYDPPVTEKVDISCDESSHAFDVSRFGTTRVHVVVEEGLIAQLDYDNSADLLASWREGKPGMASGSWTDQLPVALTGESVFVGTSIESDGRLVIEVEDVTDLEGEDCDEPPPPPTTDCRECIGTEYYYQIVEGITRLFQSFVDMIGSATGVR